MESTASSLRVFISYHDDDDMYAGLLQQHLSALPVVIHHKRQILAGSETRRETETLIKSSQIILLMISSSYISDERLQAEQKLALRLRPGVTVVPILARPVLLGESPLVEIRSLPDNGSAIANWPKPDDAYVNIAQSLKALLDGLSKKGAVKQTTSRYARSAKSVSPIGSTDRRAVWPKPISRKVRFSQLFRGGWKETVSIVTGLQQCLASSDAGERAVAANLLSEPHISRNRWLKFLPYIASSSNLQAGLFDYTRERVQFARRPDYVLCGERVAISFPLVTLLNLNGLSIMVAWAKDTGKSSILLSMPTSCSYSSADMGEWLDFHLGSDKRRDFFVVEMLSLLEQYTELFPYGPTWATSWDSLRSLLLQGADRWLQAFGISWRPPGTWILPLVYDSSEVDVIIRPTVLDALSDPGFFPSPPQCSADMGSFIVDRGCLSEDLRSGFIHSPVPPKSKHWVRSGKLIGRTSGQLNEMTLDEMRRYHIHLIRTRHNTPDTQIWLEMIEALL